MKWFRKLVRNCTEWAWKEEQAAISGIAYIQELHAKPGSMEAHIKQHPAVAQFIAQCFAEIVRGSANYTEMKFEVNPVPPDYDWITVTVQKGKGQTPHQLRQVAEEKLKQYEQANLSTTPKS